MENSKQLATGSDDTRIILTLLNGTGYIFDVEDYMRIRRDHHIVGSMVGTCATKGWSANDCTLPVELAPWETRLLVEENLAILVAKKTHLLKIETAEEQKSYQEEFEKRITQQENILKSEKMKETERNLDKIIIGKRKKLLKQGVPEEEININPSEIMDEISQAIVFERKNALLDIPCGHAEPHDSFKVNIASQPDNTLKYLVFRDFWSQGKYVTCGDAFGADFLIYPGDPLQFHASHIVILLEDASIKCLDLVTKVRLSITVNKLCVLAYFKNDYDKETTIETSSEHIRQCNKAKQICYQTIKWMGDKDKERRMVSS